MSFLHPLQRRRKKKPSADIVQEIPQLPIPQHRRLPKYKRAQERYLWDAQTLVRHKRWAKARGHWAQHGIQLSTIERVVRQAATARMDYEDYLINDLALAKEEIAYRALIRGLNRKLRSLFTWLRHHHWLPEAQVIEDHLTETISEIERQLTTLAPHVHRRFRFKGRPGEPWLDPIVAQLDKIFRKHGMPLSAATGAILEVLALAGHGDVVNLTLVKRLIRKLTKPRP
jgi:hypothetical protein